MVAKAGEQGKGFSLVAGEGGFSSGQNISTLMEPSSFKGVSSLLNEIGTAAREQSSTVKRMEESAREISQNAVATQELSGTVHGMSRAALARVSSSLAQAMSGFKV